MRLMRAVLAAALALAALSGTPAAAQEDPAPRRMTLAQDCAARDGLSLCIKSGVKERARKVRSAAAGGFGKFTKLAGKFMGLEDAAALGKSFRFRIDLTLK